jgi:predicted dehydrogenase
MSSTTRRQFLKGSAALAAGLIIVPRHVLGGPGFIPPSDKLTLGFLGAGRQGTGLGRRFRELDGFQVIAVCDVDQTKINRFTKQTNEYYTQSRGSGSDYQACATYRDFREMIARGDIDAIVNSTPDHWHAITSIAAMKAGKDIYCEKPMSLTIKGGRAMVKAARKYDRVFQTGSMQRSRRNFRHACELVRNGYLGEIKEILVSIGGRPKPCDLPEMDPKREIDWDMWIGPAPYHPYHDDLAPPIPEQFWPRWRYYSEFGGGNVTDWGAHMFDIAQWALGMDESGPVEFIPPEDPNAESGMVIKYANGIVMKHQSFDRGNAVRFIGIKGSLDISRGFIDSKPGNIAEATIQDTETRLYKSDNHYLDFLDAVKNRTKPICDVETGHRTATVCNVTNIAYQLNRPLQWNPDKEKFIGDSEANKMRKRPIRGGWKLK